MANLDKLKGNKRFWLLALTAAVAVALVIGVVVALTSSSRDKNDVAKQSDAARFAADYAKVPSDNRFVYATSEEVIKIFESGSGLVFLGFKECPWCQQLAPVVNEAAQAEGLEQIHYLDILESRKANDNSYQKLVGFLSEYLQKDADGNPRIYVPDVTAVVNGKITSRFENEEAENATTPEEFWTKDRYKRGVEQVKQMIKEINAKDNKNNAKSNAVLLDVRTAAEYNEFHFEKAVNLDLEDIKKGKLPEVSKDTKLYVHCRSGARAAEAVALLKSAGFTNIENLGGISDVQRNGCEIC